ncbi:MAG TPA: sigma-70 family RNA polymerase sigma factor [Cytophagaceae bacterium]|nr:sigma-70 family RNA polymerase sigma factor [Cytophagaceae bacterium]
MQYTDKEILNSIRAGKEDSALTFLYKKVLPKVKHYILGNSGDEEEAFDIFQDAIMIFYKQVKTDKFKEEYEIAGFIYSVSRNLWINRVKQKNRNVSMPETLHHESNEPGLLEGLISKEREEYIMNMLSELGERCKELLLNSIYHKFSMKEICEKMGFSTEDAAKTRNYKCKQKLIALVKDNPTVKDLLR